MNPYDATALRSHGGLDLSICRFTIYVGSILILDSSYHLVNIYAIVEVPLQGDEQVEVGRRFVMSLYWRFFWHLVYSGIFMTAEHDGTDTRKCPMRELDRHLEDCLLKKMIGTLNMLSFLFLKERSLLRQSKVFENC